LAGALGEIANDTLKGDFRSIHPEESSILLLDGAARVLPGFPEALSGKAERALIRLSVRCRTGVRVTGIDEYGVDYEGPAGRQRIESRTVLWAAGVAASPFGGIIARRTGCELDRTGRVVVGPNLTVPGHPEIFVIGDLARAVDRDGNALPGVAPAAMQAGRYVAGVIRRRLAGQPEPSFRYRDKGLLATIGRASAVADVGSLHFSGLPAWLVWLFVHLMYLVGFQNRVLVFVQWAFHYFTYHRGARLIAPESRLDEDHLAPGDGAVPERRERAPVR
jgi:NADH dehydrogenase